MPNVKQGRTQERGRDESGKNKSKPKPPAMAFKIHRATCPTERMIITDNMNCTSKTNPIREAKPIAESGIFTKRIGSTNYRVSVHFSKTSRETMDDKILRLMKNEAARP